jgi:hypothetical protein
MLPPGRPESLTEHLPRDSQQSHPVYVPLIDHETTPVGEYPVTLAVQSVVVDGRAMAALGMHETATFGAACETSKLKAPTAVGVPWYRALTASHRAEVGVYFTEQTPEIRPQDTLDSLPVPSVDHDTVPVWGGLGVLKAAVHVVVDPTPTDVGEQETIRPFTKTEAGVETTVSPAPSVTCSSNRHVPETVRAPVDTVRGAGAQSNGFPKL